MTMAKRINGCTRELGKKQGFLGLPIRDLPINDSVLGLCNAMESAWELTPRELADLNAGGTLIVRILGVQHPPIMVYIEPLAPEKVED